MDLTPEERRKIYEEEKARIEAREQIEREKGGPPPESSTGLAPNIAGLLCYLGLWVTGIIFVILEQKNKWVRFHAVQSIFVFGALFVAMGILGWIPYAGPIFIGLLWALIVIFWIILMVKAYQGEYFKVLIAGDIAASIVGSPNAGTTGYRPPGPGTATSGAGTEIPPIPMGPASKTEVPPAAVGPGVTATGGPPVAGVSRREIIAQRIHERRARRSRRAAHVTGSAFAIAWSFALLIFFNYFHQYVAYYYMVNSGGRLIWQRSPFFTGDIHRWLPIFTAAMIISIVGHIVMIIFEKHVLRQAVHLIIDAFILASFVTLLAVFPFNFNVIPDHLVAANTQTGVTAVLALIAAAFAIAILVRFIRLIIGLVRTGD